MSGTFRDAEREWYNAEPPKVCEEHEYEDGERFPVGRCPACIEQAEAMYEIAMEFAMDEDRLT